ncbi:MAG: hypothetical protein IKY26_04305 [Erysipelotrichaceae bacterium]|nr:hypothetical protein [Erysipelotrichaceae bacterium]
MSNRGRHKKSNQHLVIRILGKHIANRMMECQKEQGNIPNLDVFLAYPTASSYNGGFNWSDTKEGHQFWDTKIIDIFREHHLYKKWKNDRC